MAQVRIAQSHLFGPAGNATTDKRVRIAQSHLDGTLDKRVRIAMSGLEQSTLDVRVRIAQSYLQGTSSPPAVAYYGTSSGWVPVSIYLPGNGSWTKIA